MNAMLTCSAADELTPEEELALAKAERKKNKNKFRLMTALIWPWTHILFWTGIYIITLGFGYFLITPYGK
jgi:polyferredoxin